MDKTIIAAAISAGAVIIAALISGHFMLRRQKRIERDTDNEPSKKASTRFQWLLPHRRYPPERIKDEVRIHLQSPLSISMELGRVPPRLYVYFRLSNASLVDLDMDRLLVDLWVGQPTLEGAILHRYHIPHQQDREITFTAFLSTPQVEQIKGEIKDNKITSTISVHVDAYFDSRGIRIHKERRFELRDIPCEMPGG